MNKIFSSKVKQIVDFTPDEKSLTLRTQQVQRTITNEVRQLLSEMKNQEMDRAFALMITFFEDGCRNPKSGKAFYFKDDISDGQIFNHIFKSLKTINCGNGYSIKNFCLVKAWLDRPKHAIVNKILKLGACSMARVNKQFICGDLIFDVISAKTNDENCGIDNLKLAIRSSQPRKEVLSNEQAIRRIRSLKDVNNKLMKEATDFLIKKKYELKIENAKKEIKILKEQSEVLNENDKYWNYLKSKIKLLSDNIRKKARVAHGALSIIDVGKVAKFFGVGVKIYDDLGDLVFRYDVNKDPYINCELKKVLNDRYAGMTELLLYEDHYWCIKKKGMKNENINTASTREKLDKQYTQSAANSHIEVEEKKEGKEEIDEKTKAIIDTMIDHINRFDGHIILPGAGGTGKSFIIKHFKRIWEKLYPCRYVDITSTTGLSAANLEIDKVSTIHSYTGLGFHLSDSRINFSTIRISNEKKLQIYQCDVLIIDEASKLGAKAMDNLNDFLQWIKKSERPFGGIHLILATDYLQTSPIKDTWHFTSKVWKDIFPTLLPIQTPHGYRYQDEKWFDLLQKVRFAKVGLEEHSMLVKRVFTEAQLERYFENKEKPLRVCATRDEVDKENDKMLQSLSGDEEIFKARDKVKQNDGTYLMRDAEDGKSELNYRIPPILTLKIGVRVMLRTNMFQSRYSTLCSGSIGTLIRINKDKPSLIIKFDSLDDEFELEEQKIEKRTGFPIILANCATIDICQGLSMNAIIVDLRKLSLYYNIAGKVYTAFSRVRTIDGLFIIKDPNGPNGLSYSKICVNKNAVIMLDVLESHVMESKQNMEEIEFDEDNDVLTADEKDVITISLKQNPLTKQEKTRRKVRDENENDRIDNDEKENEQARAESKYKYKLTEDMEKLRYSKLREKLIVLDYETYSDANKTVPYYCYVEVYENGLLKDCREFEGEDTSKETFEYVFSFLQKNSTALEKFKKSKKLKKQKKKKGKVSWLEKPYTLLAYNGSNFDFHIFLNEMIKNKSKLGADLILKQSSAISIKIKDATNECVSLQIHDLCKILTASLDSMCKEFKCKQSKGYFPHNLIKGPKDAFQEFVSVKPEDFPPAHRKSAWEDIKAEIKQYIDSGLSEDEAKERAWSDKFNRWPIYKNLKKYGPDDVKCLMELYDKVDQLCYQVMGNSVLCFPTAANMAFKGGIMHIPAKYLHSKTQTKIKTRIYTCTKDEDLICRGALYGGNSKPRFLEWKSSNKNLDNPKYEDIDDYYVYLDIKSMYVSIMKNMKFPYNEHRAIKHSEIKKMEQYLQSENSEEWEKIGFCILLVDAEMHPHEVEPPVPRKAGTKLTKTDTGIEFDMSERQMDKVIWDNGLRRAYYTSVDIKLILKNGGKIHKVHKGLIWKCSGQLFENWMNVTIKGKDEAEKNNNTGLRAFYKLLGNAFYGALCRKECDSCASIVTSLTEKDRFHANNKWTGISDLQNGTYLFTGEKLDKYSDHYKTTRASYLGAFVLSYSRMIFDEIYNCVNPWRRDIKHPNHLMLQPLYGDTDSLMVHISTLPRLRAAGLIGTAIGQLGDEVYKDFNVQCHSSEIINNPDNYRHAKIIEYYGPAPKVYTGKYILPPCTCLNDSADSKVQKMKFKAKGIPLTNDSLCIIDEKGEVIAKKAPGYDEVVQAIKEKKEIKCQYRAFKRKGINLTKNETFMQTEIFTIGTPIATRTLFKNEWNGRKKIKREDNGITITVPNDYPSN